MSAVDEKNRSPSFGRARMGFVPGIGAGLFAENIFKRVDPTFFRRNRIRRHGNESIVHNVPLESPEYRLKKVSHIPNRRGARTEIFAEPGEIDFRARGP